MPKIKSSKAYLLREWIGNDTDFSVDGTLVYCQPCQKQLTTLEKKTHFTQHKESASHQRNSALFRNKEKAMRQHFINSSLRTVGQLTSAAEEFNISLCSAFITANIPLHTLSNPLLKAFLQKEIMKSIPDESMLQRSVVDRLFGKTVKDIQEYIGNHNIYIMVDETTDSCGRYMVNIMVGKLETEEPGPAHLIYCKELEKVNHQTVAIAVRDGLKVLWLEQTNNHKVLLLVTDSAAYMLKAGGALMTLYTNIVHFTCLAHALHRVAEEIRPQYPDVNKVISTVKKVFLKAPSRTLLFKDMLPNIPLPPEPVLTRWGTWIEAATYYSEHFNEVKHASRNVLLPCLKPCALKLSIKTKTFEHKSLKIWTSLRHAQLERQRTQFSEKECRRPWLSSLQIFIIFQSALSNLRSMERY